MSVLISMQVGPVDWEKFQAAIEWANSLPAAGHISKIGRASCRERVYVLV